MEVPLATVSTPEELARVIIERRPAHIGVFIEASRVGKLFDSISEILTREGVFVGRAEGLGGPPINVPATAIDWRDRLIVELRTEQQAAQLRLSAARESGSAADANDRDVAGWLAAGLCDLLADPITGEVFLKSGGVLARLAGDAEARFAESDFLRPDGIRFLEASRPAQVMLTKLSLASTSQFRSAAARLVNGVLERHSVVPERSILVDAAADSGALAALHSAPRATQLIVAIANEESLPEQLRQSLQMVRFVEAVPAVPAPLAAALTALHDDQARAEMFIRWGLIRAEELPADIPAKEDVEIVEELRERLHTRLVDAWRGWFARQLATFDAEGFLSHEGIAGLADYVEAAQAQWGGDAADLALPATDADFAAAEKVIADLRRLELEWRTLANTPVEEGMAFDAAVEAGRAPLDLLTEGVEWWLREENRDWSRYRIVRSD
jgi:hypothetical protein